MIYFVIVFLEPMLTLIGTVWTYINWWWKKVGQTALGGKRKSAKDWYVPK